MFDGAHDPDEVAGEAFGLVTAQDGRKSDTVLPHPGGPVQGGGKAELEFTLAVVLQDIVPGAERLDDAVLIVGRVAFHVDLPLLVAEEWVGERHHGKDSENPPYGGPSVLEGNGNVLGHHSAQHQRSDNEREDEADLDEILECAAKVGHFSRSLRRERTALMAMVYR